MKISKIQKGLVVVTVAVGSLAMGCELIVDFDRTKIPVEGPDTSVPDTGVPDTGSPGPDAAEAGGEEDGGADADDQ